MPLKIAYVLMKYPTLSQTFIEREMRALAASGMEIEVHPCLDFRRTGSIRQSVPLELKAIRAGSAMKVILIGLLRLVRELWRRPSLLWQGGRALLKNLPRHAEGWFHTLWGTLFAFARVEEFRRRQPDVIHGAWATAPATVAAVLGELCRKPYSFGAHAYDLHRHGGDPLLPAKMRDAAFVHTTTQTNVEHLQTRFPNRRAEIVLSRRGLPELPPPVERTMHNEVRILSVGRLVPKKGQIWQVKACQTLAERRLPFQLRIIGEGPLRGELEAAVAKAGLSGLVELVGEQSPAEVQAAYRWADVFWHAGVVDAQGDRDGLPNVIPEAFAYKLPVISSVAGGAWEAVTNEVTGLVVDPTDTVAAANALERLARDERLRRGLGEEGRRWTEENFQSGKNAALLVEAFAKAAKRR